MPLAPIKQCWIYNTLREGYIHEHRFVIKRYLQFTGSGDPRRIWQREHRALVQLQGLPVPWSPGFVVNRHDRTNQLACHIKTYVAEGRTEQLDHGDLVQLPLLDAIHCRGVVTLDPRLDNLVRDRDRQLHFIDLGRARVHSRTGVLFCVNVGKELCRLYRQALWLDAERFDVFLRDYRQRSDLGRLGSLLLRSSLHAFLWRYRLEDRHASTR